MYEIRSKPKATVTVRERKQITPIEPEPVEISVDSGYYIVIPTNLRFGNMPVNAYWGKERPNVVLRFFAFILLGIVWEKRESLDN
jgi:hypothetical protein